ncbi:MAG: AraC family transcriptional regulator [Desulfatibacillum sp.]|nr:AraC family transcriptional regulator [Desulfatibacillum sp.]
MPRQPTVSSHMVQNLKRYLLGQGRDFGRICAAAGISSESAVFSDPEARLFAGDYLNLFLESKKASGDPCFGLNFGREMARSYPGGSVLISMMMNCPTVGEALDRFFRYHDLMADALRPCMNIDGDFVRLGWKPTIPGFHPPVQIAETLLSFFAGILEFLGEGRVVLHEVRFHYPKPGSAILHEQRFQAPLMFDQPESVLVIRKSFLSLPVPLSNSALLETLENFANKLLHRIYFSKTWSHRVGENLSARLLKGKPFGVDAVARDLGVSARSLQGRLKEEGATYRQILDYVRRETALKCLQDGGMTLCDIAFLLGFSEQSAFNRAFKRWTGSNPKACLPKD